MVLSRLEGVRRFGPGWIARCPAHRDRDPSLSIAEGDDSRVLLHCFALCNPLEIVTAIGLTMADLFVRVPNARTSPAEQALLLTRLLDTRRATTWKGIKLELSVIAAACTQLRAGIPLSDIDSQRMLSTSERITAAREVFRGR